MQSRFAASATKKLHGCSVERSKRSKSRWPRTQLKIPINGKRSRTLADLETKETKPAQEGTMQMAITFLAVVAGMVFSLSVALLAEGLIFGQVFRLFFARQTATAKPGQKR